MAHAEPGAAPAAGAGRRRAPRRRPVPTILQMEAVECGAACLTMVLAHHGRWLPLEQVREACGVSRDGTKATNLLKAARRFGMNARGFKKDPEKLLDLPWPLVIHWNFNHFVVLEGIDARQAWLNDPARGQRRVTRQEFDESFTGVALAFEPGPEFRPGGKPQGTLPRLARFLRQSKLSVLYVTLASLALVVPAIVVAAFSKVFVDEILVGKLEGWLRPLVAGMALTAVLRHALRGLQQSQLVRLEAKLSVALSARYLWRVLELPMAFFAQRHPGELVNRIGANDRVSALLSGDFATTLINVASMALVAAVMATYDPLLCGVGVALVAANFWTLRAVGRHREEASRRLLTEQGKLLSATVGAIRSIETLKANGREADAMTRWLGHQANLLNAQQSLGALGASLGALPGLTTALTTAAILGLGALRVMDGQLSVGELVAFQTLMTTFTAPVADLVRIESRLRLMAADLARLDDVFAYPSVTRTGEAARAAPDAPAKLRGEIELREVSFGYNPLDPPLLEALTLALRPGMRVALVGGSGSGKSTLGKVLTGLYAPWSGEVSFDGRARAAWPAAVLAGSIAYVDQDIFLFGGTLRENLTLWDPSVSDAAITAALHDAEIHAEIASRPGHYDCTVTEGGTNFSGGQRQRLEIARALVLNPSILVLDEATAALDAVTEKRIDDNLRRRGCTCVIIAHRLSTIRDCDEILVMRRGRIVERGTHEALLARDGHYAKLIGHEH
jgi:NHLM bacteriocin system ABC transporter peptidase/ATP-binding protein